MTHRRHRPDPGREGAIAFLVATFDNDRHRKPRTCLGCGGAGQMSPGQYSCYSGGPSVYEWCTECYAETGHGTVWTYKLSWDQFWRITRPAPEGQLALGIGS